MTIITVYPLEQVIEVKQRRVDEAEKVVKEKQAALEKEQETLKKKEADRDKAKQHSDDKLKQMREEMDKGTTSPKILQMRAYLKVTKERVAIEEKKVKDQKVQVETAQKNLEAAKEQLKIKRQEVDKLLTHRKDWMKEMKKEQEIIEGREQDEIGSTLFSIHHPRGKN
ncbi:MAG: YscO family type III secretion system apparatus protein [Parachlamydiaceae bacterium]|nr:YscO family type III secretion system apparatus protein [Parachlamydiaceae bacterium]